MSEAGKLSRVWRRLRRRLILDLLRYPARWAPYTDRGDRLAHWLTFFRQHDRFPSRRMLFNDVLYRIKIGLELVRPERTFTSDKELVKHYVTGVAGTEHIVPTLAVLRTPEEVRAFDFPVPCVVKPTNGSGGVHFVTEDTPPDRETMIGYLSENYYYVHRERNYRALTPKLIVEPLLFNGDAVNEYKIFCWNGEPRCVLFVTDRNREFSRRVLDTEWREFGVKLSPFGVTTAEPERPEELERMFELARKLSAPFTLVRVDFYVENGRILLGELTHLHSGANEKFKDLETEELLSRQIFGADYDGPL